MLSCVKSGCASQPVIYYHVLEVAVHPSKLQYAIMCESGCASQPVAICYHVLKVDVMC